MSSAAGPDWKLVRLPSGLSYREYTKPFIKSDSDNREYRIIELANGLQALLVRDDKTDVAAASLNVGVGHLDDPDDMPGLAHFCEHLLFMGTEQYPKENEYSDYLAKWNGSSNAYTSSSNTNYFFSVAPQALGGALERFAGFFHSPLFSPSCTTRELNAVDSEHKKNHQVDVWRIFQLNKHLSRPGHPWSKFGTGSRASLSKAARDLKAEGKLRGSGESTLSAGPSPLASRSASPSPSTAGSEADEDGGSVGQETRRRLVEWWRKEYSANRMHLCVLGQGPLEELTEMVLKEFSPIRNHCAPLNPRITEHPFGVDEKGTLVSVDTILSMHALEISFPLEYQPPLKYKPAYLLSHLVGHEGPGSLFSYLKNKHWATSLSAGPQSLAHGFAMFKVTVHLTPEGLAHYRDVVHSVFQYFSLLRDAKIDDFHYEEGVALSKIKFKFLEKKRPADYVTTLSEIMCWPVPPEELLSRPWLEPAWENESDRTHFYDKLKQYLDEYRIQGCRVVLMAKQAELAKVLPDAQWQKEPWYGTPYDLRRFDNEFVKKCNSPNDNPELFLPRPNEFIPTKLDVEKKEGIKPVQRPHLIRETPLSCLWYKKDDQFWLPRSRVYFDFRCPNAFSSARAAVLSRLYVDLVNDGLTEYSYDASLAGLAYTLSSTAPGIHLSVAGYSDKMPHLVKRVLEGMHNFHADPARLDVMKEQVRRGYENFYLDSPHSLADYYLRYTLTVKQWSVPERLAELPTITAAEVEEHGKRLFSEGTIRILGIGNFYKDEIIRLAEMAENGLKATSRSQTELNEHGFVVPDGFNYTWTSPILNLNEGNSAISYYVHIGDNDIKTRVTASLLNQIISEPAFNVLRTREQLGYIVFCNNMVTMGSTSRGMRVLVQSERSPAYLENRIEAFLDEMKEKLETISESEFDEHRNSLKKQWLEADKNLGSEAARFQAQLTTWHLDFLRAHNDAAFLDSVTKEDVVRMFMERVHPSSTTRSKFSVHMVSQKSQPQVLSPTAVSVFEDLIRKHFPHLDPTSWRTTISTSTPTLVEFGQYWLQHLNSDAGKQILFGLPALVQKFPAEVDKDDVLPGATIVTDVKEFQRLLTVAPEAEPVEWNDLPQAKI